MNLQSILHRKVKRTIYILEERGVLFAFFSPLEYNKGDFASSFLGKPVYKSY